MVRFGVDFAFGHPGGAALAAEGVTAVGRYVPYPGDGGKGLTKAEAGDYLSNGIDVFLFWETVAARHRDGYIAGVNDAKQCLASAADLGVPDDVAFYPAVDFAPGAADWQPIRDYQRGFMSVVGPSRTGIYGNFDVIEYAHDNQLATWFCQCVAWSGGKLSDWRHIFQDVGPNVAGTHVDHLTIYGDEFGQWKGGLSVDDKARLDRLEKLLAGNGIAKDLSKPAELTFGEDALAYAAERGWSAFLGLGLNQTATAEVQAELDAHKKGHPAGGSLKGTTFTGVIQ